MWQEFKDFINRGSVVDLAVGVTMGAAFTAIVTSLTDDIIMPFVGVLLGGVDFSSLTITVGDANIAYGKFIQAIINFIIIAAVLFFVVKGFNRMQDNLFEKKKKEAAAKVVKKEPPADVQLLTEIRDLLKEQSH